MGVIVGSEVVKSPVHVTVVVTTDSGPGVQVGTVVVHRVMPELVDIDGVIEEPVVVMTTDGGPGVQVGTIVVHRVMLELVDIDGEPDEK